MSLSIFCTTWNTGLQGSKAQSQDLSSWLLPVLQGHDTVPDVYAIAVQELLPVHLALAGLASPVIIALTSRIQSLLSSHSTSLSPNRTSENYLLVSRVAHGGNALWVFAREATLGQPGRLGRALEAKLGLWYGGMGNKGAVGVRVPVRREDGGWEVLTFVNTHLEAHDHNIARRNTQYQSILSSLLFRPSDPLAETYQITDSSHLFFMGDLNYRLTRLPVLAAGEPREGVIGTHGAKLPSADGTSDGARVELEKERADMFALDTLTKERDAGRVFGGFREGEVVGFAPTYKRIVGQVGGYSRKRIPGWTDRILYNHHPSALPTRVITYSSTPSLTLSDHKPVHCLFELPLSASDNTANSLQPIGASAGLAPRLAKPPAPHVLPEPVAREVLLAWQVMGWVLDRTIGWPWCILVLLGAGNLRAGLGVGAFVGMIWGVWWSGVIGGNWAA